MTTDIFISLVFAAVSVLFCDIHDSKGKHSSDFAIINAKCYMVKWIVAVESPTVSSILTVLHVAVVTVLNVAMVTVLYVALVTVHHVTNVTVLHIASVVIVLLVLFKEHEILKHTKCK